MKPLRFADGNVGWVFSEVKSFWEEDAREFVLRNARKQLERMLQVEFRREHKSTGGFQRGQGFEC